MRVLCNYKFYAIQKTQTFVGVLPKGFKTLTLCCRHRCKILQNFQVLFDKNRFIPKFLMHFGYKVLETFKVLGSR